MSAGAPDLAEIDDAIARIDRAAEIGASEGTDLEFGLGDRLAEDWDRIAGRIDELMGALIRIVGHYAWVETRVETKVETKVETALAAVTAVSYKGDMTTVFAPELNADQFGTHLRSLGVALEYRMRFTRLLIASVRTVSAVLAALSFPGAAAGAVRSAWQLITELQAILN